jgi:hypothetical protein
LDRQEIHLLLARLVPPAAGVEDLFQIHLQEDPPIQHFKVDLVEVEEEDLLLMWEQLVADQETFHLFLHHKEMVEELAAPILWDLLAQQTIRMRAAEEEAPADLVEMLVYREDLQVALVDLVDLDLQSPPLLLL